jgi:hypothetical protein
MDIKATVVVMKDSKHVMLVKKFVGVVYSRERKRVFEKDFHNPIGTFLRKMVYKNEY